MDKEKFIQETSKLGLERRATEISIKRFIKDNKVDYENIYNLLKRKYEKGELIHSDLDGTLDNTSRNYVHSTSGKKPNLDTQEGTPEWYQ